MANVASEDRTAHELLEVLGTGRQWADFSVPDMDAAGRITQHVRSLREARGERVVGRKIGFSNKLIWATYGIDRPIWNYVWDTTVLPSTGPDTRVDLSGFPEPRIEPEIVLHLARAPQPGMSEEDLLECVDRVAHGFEIVQSVFPGWKFTAAGSAAAFGLHGALMVGPWHHIEQDRIAWGALLRDFTVTLRRNGVALDTGRASNVLGGPVTALRYLVEAIASESPDVFIRANEIVTTGTLTDAFPIAPGELWSTEFDGIGLTGLQLGFR